MTFHRSYLLALALIAAAPCFGCTVEVEPIQFIDFGDTGVRRSDAGFVDAGRADGGRLGADRELDAGMVDAGPPVCARGRLTTFVGEEAASEAWISLPAEPPSFFQAMIATEDNGALWLFPEDGPVQENTPANAFTIVAMNGLDRPVCADTVVTWQYERRHVRIDASRAARLPSCDEGTPVAGTVEACIDVLGSGCDGQGSNFVSTVEGFEAALDDGNYHFGGSSGGPFVFHVPNWSGVGSPSTSGGGYALAYGDTLFCVGSVSYSPGGRNAPSRLRLSNLRRLGSCRAAEYQDGLELHACVGP